VLRLRAPSSGAVTYRDLVFGEVTTPNSTQQDAVLMRSDGVPLYNLGAVVDDVTMGVTLVARGRDHMINTPVQILLYQALGYDPPEFAHLPMMLNSRGEKYSKRDGAVAVGDYRDRGIPAAGLLNYLVRFGWSYGDEEIFSLADLVQKFGWDRCGTADGKYDAKKFTAIVFEHLKSPALTSDADYAAGVVPFLEARGIRSPDEATLLAALPLVRPRAQSFVEAAEALDYFFRDPPAYDEKAVSKFLGPDKAARLADLHGVLAGVPEWKKAPLEATVAAWLSGLGIELKDVAQPTRVAVTGRSASPGLFEVMEILGKGRTLARLDHAVLLGG
jgi:glutamyl-tRNA synthetase